MDFELTEDQRAVEDAARRFAVEKLAPHAAQWDETEHFPSMSCARRRRWASPASM